MRSARPGLHAVHVPVSRRRQLSGCAMPGESQHGGAGDNIGRLDWCPASLVLRSQKQNGGRHASLGKYGHRLHRWHPCELHPDSGIPGSLFARSSSGWNGRTEVQRLSRPFPRRLHHGLVRPGRRLPECRHRKHARGVDPLRCGRLLLVGKRRYPSHWPMQYWAAQLPPHRNLLRGRHRSKGVRSVPVLRHELVRRPWSDL
mmetsp:Transcript_19923/g.56424  ORF Transcript_19923/g.56424 Transcript_19923/m.56424 type:complete len:201 (+) Transcript_19923:533-1135(+)